MIYANDKDRAAAATFARMWYARPDHGCDEKTLTSMLEQEIAKARLRGRDDQAEDVLDKIAAAIGIERDGSPRASDPIFKVGDKVEVETGEQGVLVEINPARVDDRYKVWLGFGHVRERREVWHPGTRPVTPPEGQDSEIGQRISKAISIAVRYGDIDGAHHKTWVIDQMVRILAGDEYPKIVADACAGEDGPNTYEWSTGIAP